LAPPVADESSRPGPDPSTQPERTAIRRQVTRTDRIEVNPPLVDDTDATSRRPFFVPEAPPELEPTRVRASIPAELPEFGPTHVRGAPSGPLPVDSGEVEVEATRVRAVTSDPLIGAMLGEYRVLAPLGAGGVGLVYRGEQPVIGRPVAIKVLKPEYAQDPNHVRRFLDEAKSVSAARHPGIIDVFSFGQTAAGAPYLVMELLEGEPLDVLLQRRGALPVKETLSLVIPMLNALGAAHAAGVIHRDLKPGNVFIVHLVDGTTFPKLLDFGLARRGEVGATVRQTSVGGTPLYIAPEQARGEPVGPQTDLYSFGCLLFEMLVGRPPFTAVNLHVLLDQHLTLAAPSVRESAPHVSDALEKLVHQMLEKEPTKRPASAFEVRDRLEQLADELVPVRREASGVRRNPRLATDAEVSSSRRVARSGDEEVSASRRNPRLATDEEVSASRRASRPGASTALVSRGRRGTGGEGFSTEADEEPSGSPRTPTPVDVPVAPKSKVPVILGIVTLIVALGVALALWPREAPQVPLPPVVPTQPIVQAQPVEPVKEPTVVARPEPEPIPEVVPEMPETPEPAPVPVVKPRAHHHRAADVKKRLSELRRRAGTLPDNLKRAAGVQLDEAAFCTEAPDRCWDDLTEIEKTFFKK
jgi:serine/threonine-protein kinase